MQRALERALAELTLGRAIAEDDAVAIDAWLMRHEIPEHERPALRREFPKLLVYRELVQGTLRGALEQSVPRSIARLGAVFAEYFAAFLAAAPPRTRYLRDVTTSFLEYVCAPMAEDGRVPAYIPDLLRHEALHIELSASWAAPDPAPSAELLLDARVRFTSAVRLVDYAWAVQRLPADPADLSVPERVPVSLFVYRSPEHDVRYLELSPLARALLEGLLAGSSLGHALPNACAKLGVSLEKGVLEGAARLLADLAERGVVLGAGAKSEPHP